MDNVGQGPERTELLLRQIAQAADLQLSTTRQIQSQVGCIFQMLLLVTISVGVVTLLLTAVIAWVVFFGF